MWANLLAEETRPRCEAFPGGVVVNLRGVNLNPGADPADMVAVRLWVDSGKIISVRGRHLMAIDDIRAEIAAGRGPHNPGDLVVDLAAKLVVRMSSVLSGLDAARERAAVIHDELANRQADKMQRTMYALAVLAGVFLPLGLITELFGVGLGGMPGTETPWAFPALCLVLLVVAGIEVWLFRRLKWI